MILDTTFIIDILNGKMEAAHKTKELLKRNEPLKATSISVFEIWQGTEDIQNQSKKGKDTEIALIDWINSI